MTLQLTAPRTGFGLILAGVACFGAWLLWVHSPMWVPLNIEMPPSQGHIRTTLKTSVESDYRIVIAVGPCPASRGCQDDSPIPRADWSLSGGGQVIAGGSSDSNSGEWADGTEKWRELGIFRAARGHYLVDVYPARDRRPANGGAARLKVFEMGGWRADANNQAGDAALVSLLLVVAGIFLTVRETKIRSREKAADLARAYSLSQPGPQPRNLRVSRAAVSPTIETGFHPPPTVWVGLLLVLTGCSAYAYLYHWDAELVGPLMGLCSIGIGVGVCLLAITGAVRFRKLTAPVAPCEPAGPVPAHVRWKVRSSRGLAFQGMPSFGLVAFLFYFCVAIPFWLIQPVTPRGLMVHLLRPGPATWRVPGLDPLLVQVTCEKGGRRARVYVNWQPVSWEELGAVVQKELVKRPPNWPVYVEGDPENDWNWVGRTIDTIQGLRGEVYLLTTWRGLPRGQPETKTTHNRPDTRPLAASRRVN